MGAIGGFYGAKLARAGREVHFLSHSDYEYVLSHGLHITSCDGDFSLPHINAYGSPDEMPVADVVIVGLKTTNEHLLRTLLPPLLHPGTLWQQASLSSALPRQSPGTSITSATAASPWATIPVGTKPSSRLFSQTFVMPASMPTKWIT